LHLGDVAGYRRVSRRMRRRFHRTSHLFFVTEVVRASLLNPDPDVDRAHLVKLADLAVANAPGRWYESYLAGIAHYRAGQPEQAVRLLRASVTTPDWAGRALSYPVLAMAHHRLGQAAEARRALGEAAQAIDRWTQEMYQSQGHEHWVHHLG